MTFMSVETYQLSFYVLFHPETSSFFGNNNNNLQVLQPIEALTKQLTVGVTSTCPQTDETSSGQFNDDLWSAH